MSLVCHGQKTKDEALIQRGLGQLGRVATLRRTSEKDDIDKQHAAQIIADPKLACGYSRDGQQDLDEKKIKT